MNAMNVLISLSYWQRLCLMGALGLALCSVTALYANPNLAVDRYSSVKLGPTLAQKAPLKAVVRLYFDPTVKTVGQAVAEVLKPTGYQLAAELPESVKATLLKPLPVTQRRLGRLRVATALTVLMGVTVFRLQENALSRTVNFRLTSAYKTHRRVHAPHHSTLTPTKGFHP